MRERLKTVGFALLLCVEALGDALLGGRCVQCGDRVYNKDLLDHNRKVHPR